MGARGTRGTKETRGTRGTKGTGYQGTKRPILELSRPVAGQFIAPETRGCVGMRGLVRGSCFQLVGNSWLPDTNQGFKCI